MFVGILFTGLVSLSVGLFGMLAFAMRGAVNQKYRGDIPQSFAIFWFLMSLVWFCTALTDFSGYFKLYHFSLLFTYVLQICVGASLIAAAYFLDLAAFDARKKRWVVGAYSLLYTLFLLTLFQYGVQPRPEDFFASQVTSSGPVLFMFTVMFLPLWIAALWFCFRTLVRKHQFAPALYRFYLFSSLSLIVLGAAGSLDETGIVRGWAVTAARLVTLVSAVFAYLAITALQESEELVI